jgi:carboxyl-terminal processing protease
MPTRVLLSLMLAATSATAQQLTATDRAQAVAAVWAEAKYNYAWWDHVRADWDSALAANLRAAGEAQSDVRFYRRLRRLVALLNDGETSVQPSNTVAGRLARPPIALRAVEGRPFIVDYAETDELRIARPERLAEIVEVQSIPAATWIRDSVLPEVAAATDASRWARAVERMLEGDRGTAVYVLLKLPGGATRGASVTRSAALNQRWPLTAPALAADTLPDGALWLRIADLSDPGLVQVFDREVGDFARVKGLILDLRDADGATPAVGYDLLARLTGKPFVTPRWRTPQYRPALRAWGILDSTALWYTAPPDTVRPVADRTPYGGPVAVLVSSRTGGAAEDFVVAFRNAGRGPVIGETTAGATGQTLTVHLVKGWTLSLCVQREAFPDGVEFGQMGIAPEMPVALKVGDFLAGKDAVLEAARAYLATRPAPHD